MAAYFYVEIQLEQMHNFVGTTNCMDMFIKRCVKEEKLKMDENKTFAELALEELQKKDLKEFRQASGSRKNRIISNGKLI